MFQQYALIPCHRHHAPVQDRGVERVHFGTQQRREAVVINEMQPYACVRCGVSYSTPEPQLFSFNSPQGMCRDCDGLGVRYDFDLETLIPDDQLSLNEGAIELLGPIRDMVGGLEAPWRQASVIVNRLDSGPDLLLRLARG